MTDPQNTITITGLIQERVFKRIVFAHNGLTIEQSLGFGPDRFIAGDSIAAFRFGVRELRGYKFSFGRQYFIEIKNFNCEIYRIKLNSLFGIKRKEYYRTWAELLQNIWDFYLDNQLSYYTELYNIQQTFELAGVTFHNDGISWDKNNYLPWDKIAVKSYQNYFMIHHADNARQYKCCVFSIDWNAVVLQSLLKEITRQYSRSRRTIRKGL
ncbi:hypothetical protein [Mucilaginibacter ginsenosidivorans]|uniref:Uncharacterized protein n=1 Tax=Mucilaginibacter ginsenosidivorans TaxID=398053 RepID=A0A5B8UZZ1_9SPHI|nr:hypothetical protein [Mucilaginibacter ginsenosidivorans]QEC63931.1 hypothetical protein FRZ54_15555 [Mucilaginibacter ginsenosidivorans]